MFREIYEKATFEISKEIKKKQLLRKLRNSSVISEGISEKNWRDQFNIFRANLRNNPWISSDYEKCLKITVGVSRGIPMNIPK